MEEFSMKKMLMAVAMLVVMAGAASAQGGGGGGGGGGMQMTPQQMADRTIGLLFKDIPLSDAQKTKATDIITKASTDSRAIDRAAPDAADKRKAISDKRNADLK